MGITFRSLVFVLLGLVFLAGRASAVPVGGLYDALVAVPDTSESERAPALSRALEKVLIRVTGNAEVLQREGIESVLANAAALVQAYRYQQPAGTAEDNLQLAVSFGAVGVTRALAEIGVPVWGANRPAILAWVAVQSRSGRSLATADADSQWGAVMEAAAREKGIPLVLPEYDDADRATVGMSDIWGLFMAPVEAASERYRSDLLAVARISEAAEGYRARWTLQGAGVNLEGQAQGDSSQAVADAITRAWAEALAARYAVAPADGQALQMVDVVIGAVESLEAYAEIRQSLAAMEPVSGAAPVRVAGDSLRIRLAFNGELDVLREHLALERRLIEQAPDDYDASGAAVSPPAAAPADSDATTDEEIAEADPSARLQGSDEPPLDPAIRPIPVSGEPVSAIDSALMLEPIVQDDDFKSLYPVLHFKWIGSVRQGRGPGPAGTDSAG